MTAVAFVILDPKEFMTEGILLEDAFLEQASTYNWAQFAGKKVLVRGCSSTIIPPWVYMYITARLTGVARSIRFGNEHSNVVVYRAGREEE